MKLCSVLLLMLTWTGIGRAQAPGDVVRMSGATIDSAFRDLARNPAQVALDLSREAIDRYQFVVLSKRATTPAEIHERWTDVVFVRNGNAVLQTGSILVDKEQSDPGEWKGSAIKNPEAKKVSAGDVIVIAAGVAHQWRITGSKPFSYTVVKLRLGGAAP